MSEDQRQERDEATVRQEFWRKIGRVAAQIPFAEDAIAAYYCAFDRLTPAHVRVVLIGALAYFIAPIDVLPDVLPVVGLTDDAAVLAGTIKLIYDNMKPSHRDAARAALDRLNRD